MRTLEDIKILFSKKGYNLLTNFYQNNKTYLTFEKDGYLYYNTYNGFIKTDNFKKWGKNNPYSIHNLKNFIKLNGLTCKVISTSFNYNNTLFKCECGENYSVSISNFINKKQYKCFRCGRKSAAIKHTKTEYYLKEMEERGFVLIDDISTLKAKQASYWKDKNNYIYKIYLYNFLTTNQSIERIVFHTTNKYCAENYLNFIKQNNLECELIKESVKSSHENIELICKCGNRYSVNAWYFRNSLKDCCDICSAKKISKYESMTEIFLKENNVYYVREKTFVNLVYKKKLRIDFFLPDLNKAIEVDGEQHYKPIKLFGGEEKYKEGIKKDNIKTDFCKNNNINLLRIPFYEYKTEKYKEIIKAFIS